MPAAAVPGRVGYVISRKSLSRAVDRNRLRRRLRETMRAARPAICSFNIVVRVKRAISAHEIAVVVAEASTLLGRLVNADAA